MKAAVVLTLLLALPAEAFLMPSGVSTIVGPGQSQQVQTRKRSRSSHQPLMALETPVGTETDNRRADGKCVDYELNLGKVIDTLRADYPNILRRPLEYSIYTPDITLSDPSGLCFYGIKTYKRLFGGLRMLAQVSAESSETKFRLFYDWNTQSVRVRWNTVILLKGTARPTILDGLSVYALNDDGFVKAHKLEKIAINGSQLEPPFMPAWLNMEGLAAPRVGVLHFDANKPLVSREGTFCIGSTSRRGLVAQPGFDPESVAAFMCVE